MKRLLSFLFNKNRKYQGDKYVGDFKDGKRDGFGTYTWANGDEYGGQFKDNKRDGVGVYTWANGNKYGGIWKDDKRDGEGTYIWENGDRNADKFYQEQKSPVPYNINDGKKPKSPKEIN